MRESLLLKFRELDVEPTGLYEVTGYHDVDIALANYITRIVDNVRLNEPNDINRAFGLFTDRPASDKVIVGRFDDVPQLLRHIHTARAGRKSVQGDEWRNHDFLPVVNLSRNFMLSIGNVDRAIQSRNKDHMTIYNGEPINKNVIAVCATQPASLTYDLNIIGADKESTALLCNAVGMSLVELVNTGFTTRTRVATADVTLDCGLDAVKGFALSDVSPQAETERFYCATTQLNVLTEVVIAYNVQPILSTVRVYDPQIMEN